MKKITFDKKRTCLKIRILMLMMLIHTPKTKKISPSKNKFNNIHNVNSHIDEKADLLVGVMLLFYIFICLYFLFQSLFQSLFQRGLSNDTSKNS